MFEGAVAGILNRILGKYVQDLDTENLNVGIFSGQVNLTDLKLKPEALYELDLPIDVKIGTIGKISFQIPWANLYTQAVIIHIEDVLVLVGPAISSNLYDPEREKKLSRAAKRKILEDLESESEVLKGPKNFFEQLFTAIVNNVQIYVRNVHVRYEDSVSSKNGPLACGLCLQSLSVETTNSKWKPSVTPANATTVYQMMKIESLSLYWNPLATALDDLEIANITPMQYYNWKHYMLTGLNKFSMHQEDFEFLISPTACRVKAIVSRSAPARTPRLLADAVLRDCAIHLSNEQYMSFNNLMKSFERIKLNRKYRHLYPGVSLTKNVRKWWRYAYDVVIEQRIRPYTWASIKKHRENYNLYKSTYKSTLRSPNDTELKLDLQKCEDSLPIVSVVIAREHAKIELLSQEPELIEVMESEIDWWPSLLSSDSETELPSTEIKLCVKSERCKSLWSHLSSPEKKRVCELIGAAEGTNAGVKTKQYIEHKLNLTLANCTASLSSRARELLVVTLTQFLASMESLASSRSYKLSFRAETILIEGATADQEMVPLLTPRSSSLTTTNLLAVDIERNKSNDVADVWSCLMEPVELLYEEHTISELLSFFQTHNMTAEEFSSELSSMAEKAKKATKSAAIYAISRRKVIQLNADIKGPTIVIPAHGATQKGGQVLVVDISRLTVRSELQRGNTENATNMELEESLYHRLHADCVLQVLFCDFSAPWQDTRRHGDSELHLIPRVKAQLVFSNSIKKDYKLLPKYKLNISLSSFKLNLSDRVITQLLDFIEDLPVPFPHGSVCYLENEWEDEGDAVLMSDRISAEPNIEQLRALSVGVAKCHFAKQASKRMSNILADTNLSNSATCLSSEQSDDEIALDTFARNVDLPGFDDNVSPSNTIDTLLRFLVGEIVINLARSTEQSERPYIMLSITRLCLDVALLQYGPALQLSVGQLILTDKYQYDCNGQYLQLITGEGESLSLIYRKVRSDCPEFRSHFHNVEQALVADVGPLSTVVHADAIRTLYKYLQYITDKIQSRRVVELQKSLVPKSLGLWSWLLHPDADPPIPSGATKLSYSVRTSTLSVKLSHLETSLLDVRLDGLESECVFRANDRMIFKLYLASLHIDDLTQATLYPKLLWPEGDKVLEMKYVRCSERYYGQQSNKKAEGELRIYLSQLHTVLLSSVINSLQDFLEPLMSVPVASEAALLAERKAEERLESLKSWTTKLNLVIEIHAPVLLVPQKPSSPNLLVLSMGDIVIENFFKTASSAHEDSGLPAPVLDNILIKWENLSLARAVMSLAGTLEVQELILEPVSIHFDIKRLAGLIPTAAYSSLLLYECDATVESVVINLGQRDLATVISVYSDNLAQHNHMDGLLAGTPVEVSHSDASVKKLQEFFAQGETVRKEIVFRFTLEGVELSLFTDTDEVLSSPVREASRGLAKLSAGTTSLTVECFSDGLKDARASLAALEIIDLRPAPPGAITKVLQSRSGSTKSPHICVRRPALAEARITITQPSASGGGGTQCDVTVDTIRFNLAAPFCLQLARALLPHTNTSDKCLDGGVVNLGYVGEGTRGSGRLTSASDSTSGYCSSATTVPEESPSFTFSIRFRQPEVMFYTDGTKTENQAILLRTELLMDYSRHSNMESMVVTMAGLQIMSKLQSKYKNIPPYLVLRPCDVEFCRSFKNAVEGVKVKLTVSDVEMHIAPSTIYTVMDIIEEITSELMVPDEKEPFVFTNCNIKSDRLDEDLWSPKKLTPYVFVNSEDSYVQPKYPVVNACETFHVNIPNVKVLFEIEDSRRVPVVMMKISADLHLNDWSTRLHGTSSLRLQASVYNDKVDSWEPIVEPFLVNDNCHAPWEVNASVFQDKSYPMSFKLKKPQPESETDTHTNAEYESKAKKKKKPGFDSETSADEYDTDNEMTYMKDPTAVLRKSTNNVEFSDGGLTFLNELENDDCDSDDENAQTDKLTNAIGYLFTDDSSDDELSGGEDSSASEKSQQECASEKEDHDKDTPVSYIDGAKKEEHKSVTLLEPVHSSVDSVDCTSTHPPCTYVLIQSPLPLSVTFSPTLVAAFAALSRPREQAVVAAATSSELTLVNDVGPGSSVTLKTRAQTDLAGNDLILAKADYYIDSSRPSTPGCDTSSADLLDEEANDKSETMDITDEWDCFEGGFTQMTVEGPSVTTPPTITAYRKVADETITLSMADMEAITVPSPQRTISKLHVLPPSKSGARYYVVVERTNTFNSKKIVVRSPLQIRNETSYALELLYKKSELEALGLPLIGEASNPFCQGMRAAILAPYDTYNVPLHIAHHAPLYLLPNNFQSYQKPTDEICWMELAKDLGTPRDMVCPAKNEGDNRIFAVRLLIEEGIKTHNTARTVPNYLIRVLPPLAFCNCLPYGIELSSAQVEASSAKAEGGTSEWRIRIEAGERAVTHSLRMDVSHKITIQLQYHGQTWTSSFTLTPDAADRTIPLTGRAAEETRPLALGVRVTSEASGKRVLVHARFWIVSKGGLPLQLAGKNSESMFEVTEEPLLWCGSGRGNITRCRGRIGGSDSGSEKIRVRCHQSAWSGPARLLPAAPGLLVATHHHRRMSYRMLLNTTLSELCPQLTKIVTILPYFLVYNDTKRHLRFMEENEEADLWLELQPQQCSPFWPQSDSMAMRCKYRDATKVSQHFPINKNHFTVLRMEKRSAICVDVTGGTDSPFTITFKTYNPGDSPVRIDNLCDDLFLKMHQVDSGQVALLSPYQTMLYTWDDPMKERILMWNVYNNKGKGFAADFSQDGYGEEKVSFRSVKQQTLVATSSVTSKLSSTFKRLTPKSPEPCSSSTDDSDSTSTQESFTKIKKMQKRNKAIVYWISFMDGYQRVFALTQDERIAQEYKTRISSERSKFEVYLSLSEVSLSVCVPTKNGVKELAYASISDTPPKWEANVNHKWKQLSPELTAWIEQKHQTDQKKCQLKEYIDIDLDKMQMTKPFFAELRRSYSPGVWAQIRKSETFSFINLKLQKFQIDNQLQDAVFPCVVHRAPMTSNESKKQINPSLEFLALKQHRPSLNQDVYKYLKVLVQEHCINLDKGFVNYLFNILNDWKVEEKPAVRLRADLALVHMPLQMTAMKNQTNAQKSILFEHVHLSPIKVVLNLSSRGYLEENVIGSSNRFGRKENRPKLFNSDLMEFLFNSWGSSLCDMKDVVLRMAYLEVRNSPITVSALIDSASSHYWTQLVQQFYVLVLGLKILGNPYSLLGDFSRAIKQFYEPCLGSERSNTESFHEALEVACGSLMGLTTATTGSSMPIFCDVPKIAPVRRKFAEEDLRGTDLPGYAVEASFKDPTSIALAIAGLIARPAFDLCRSWCKRSQGWSSHTLPALTRLLPATRRRLPRVCSNVQGTKAYTHHSALGLQLLQVVSRTRDAEEYIAHAQIGPNAILLLSNKQLASVRCGEGSCCRVEWAVPIDDLMSAPRAVGNQLVLRIRQDELINYFSTEEKSIEVNDPELLNWLQSKIEYALILGLEDKRCPNN